MIAWILLAAGILALALFLAVRTNGPAVLDLLDRASAPGRDARLAATASYGPAKQQKLRIYAPRDARDLPVIVFFHGGSWSWGDPDDYGFVARALAPEGFVVVLAGYRLGESGRYPAMLEDTAAAIAEAVRLVPQHGGDPSRIVLAGHSAGAYNVVQIALEQRWLDAAGVDATHVRGVIGLSGPYDFFPFDKPSSKAAFGSVGAGAASQPVNHARPDAPPMLLVHGEQDTLVRPRNTRALAKALKDAGNGRAETVFYPAFDHNAPLISLASPWRGRRDVAERVTRFARRATALSVPVKPEMP